MSSAPKVKLSDAIAAPIISIYKAGGLGLAFLTLGAGEGEILWYDTVRYRLVKSRECLLVGSYETERE